MAGGGVVDGGVSGLATLVLVGWGAGWLAKFIDGEAWENLTESLLLFPRTRVASQPSHSTKYWGRYSHFSTIFQDLVLILYGCSDFNSVAYFVV